MKKITVITVCYNSEKTIKRVMKSVLDQRYESFEYIIIDGNSKDMTCNIIKSYLNEKVKFISENDSGIYDAMNKGLSMAKGEWILYINSDDWLEENVLEIISERLNNLKDCDVVYGDIKYLNLDFGIERIRKPLHDLEAFIPKGMPLFHPAMLVKREIMISLNGFDTNFKIAADWDLVIRLLKNKCRFSYIDVVFSTFVIGGASSNSHIIEKHAIRKKNNMYNLIDWYIFIDFKNLIIKKIKNIIGRRTV